MSRLASAPRPLLQSKEKQQGVIYVNKPTEKSVRYMLVNFEDDMHVVPQGDLFEHDANVNCPCHPYIDPKNREDMRRGFATRYVWSHRIIADKEAGH